MSWLKVDDGFDTHPKLLELSEIQRWRWTRVLIHCARHRTDGHVNEKVLRELGLGRAIERLLTIGLLETNGSPEYLVHDWADYAPKDPTKAARQARWRAKQASTVDVSVDARVDGQGDTIVDESVDDQIVHSRVDARARPVLSRPKDQNPPSSYVVEGPVEPEEGRPDDSELEALAELAHLAEVKAMPL